MIGYNKSDEGKKLGRSSAERHLNGERMPVAVRCVTPEPAGGKTCPEAAVICNRAVMVLAMTN